MYDGHTLNRVVRGPPPAGTGSKEVTVGHVDFWAKRVPSRVNRKCLIRLEMEEATGGVLSVTWVSRRSLWLLFET